MLRVEMLSCTNQKFHKNCTWVSAGLTYPDNLYNMLKQRIMREVSQSHTAYRINHHIFGVFTTVKWGHDNKLFVSDNEESLMKWMGVR